MSRRDPGAIGGRGMNLGMCAYYQTRGMPDAERGHCSHGCREEPACITNSVPVLRWACSKCGRFIAESAVASVDRVDPGAYYGVTSTTTGTCSRCGVVDSPRLIQTGEAWL